MLLAGPEQFGFSTLLWTCPRVAQVIEVEFGVKYHPGHVWKLLDRMGFSYQRPVGRALERNEDEIRQWKRKRLPANKKARREGRTIVFIDERGVSQRPHRVRT